VVFRRQQRVDGDRHHAGQQRAEEGDRQVDAVLHHQQQALFRMEAEREQAGGAGPNPQLQFGVTELRGVVDVRKLGRPGGVALQDMPGEVEALRYADGLMFHAASSCRSCLRGLLYLV
jgi:hypothetical protein